MKRLAIVVFVASDGDAAVAGEARIQHLERAAPLGEPVRFVHLKVDQKTVAVLDERVG